MFSKLHARLGTAGLVVAVVALVAALAGTAFAATKLNSTQKKEVEKIAKKYAGKPGATGATGAKGDPGAAGAAGAKGDTGSAGAPGAAGKSVTIGNTASGCAAGGKSVEVEGTPASKKEICNGEEGPEGPEGKPWTAGGVLPSNSTETGAYVITSETGEGPAFEEYAVASVTFSIPLPAEIEPAKALYIPDEGAGTVIPPECENAGHAGVAGVNNPEADPGFFCVYEGRRINMGKEMPVIQPGGSEGAGVSGALLLQPPTAAEGFSQGSWAVTAP